MMKGGSKDGRNTSIMAAEECGRMRQRTAVCDNVWPYVSDTVRPYAP